MLYYKGWIYIIKTYYLCYFTAFYFVMGKIDSREFLFSLFFFVEKIGNFSLYALIEPGNMANIQITLMGQVRTQQIPCIFIYDKWFMKVLHQARISGLPRLCRRFVLRTSQATFLIGTVYLVGLRLVTVQYWVWV